MFCDAIGRVPMAPDHAPEGTLSLERAQRQWSAVERFPNGGELHLFGQLGHDDRQAAEVLEFALNALNVKTSS